MGIIDVCMGILKIKKQPILRYSKLLPFEFIGSKFLNKNSFNLIVCMYQSLPNSLK